MSDSLNEKLLDIVMKSVTVRMVLDNLVSFLQQFIVDKILQ
jgi:hypothetical protein